MFCCDGLNSTAGSLVSKCHSLCLESGTSNTKLLFLSCLIFELPRDDDPQHSCDHYCDHVMISFDAPHDDVRNTQTSLLTHPTLRMQTTIHHIRRTSRRRVTETHPIDARVFASSTAMHVTMFTSVARSVDRHRRRDASFGSHRSADGARVPRHRDAHPHARPRDTSTHMRVCRRCTDRAATQSASDATTLTRHVHVHHTSSPTPTSRSRARARQRCVRRLQCVSTSDHGAELDARTAFTMDASAMRTMRVMSAPMARASMPRRRTHAPTAPRCCVCTDRGAFAHACVCSRMPDVSVSASVQCCSGLGLGLGSS